MSEQRRAKSPRFELPNELPKVKITKDDETILWYLYRRRLVGAQHVYSLLPERSQDKLSRRLNLLRKARYVWRMEPPEEVWKKRKGGGSDHFVYALDYKGAQLLSQEFGVKLPEEKWRTSNEELAWKNVPHTLGITDFMVAVELARRQHATTSLIEFDELLKSSPEPTQLRAQPERFRTNLTWNGQRRREGIAPDEIFALRNTASARGDRTMYYFLELDRGKETIVPGAEARKAEWFFRQSSILKKFVIYTHAFRNKTHTEWFGFPKGFRVLYVTRPPTRRENMQAAFREHMMPRPIQAKAGMNLFADSEMMERYSDDIFAMPWQDEIGREFYIDGRGDA